MEENKKLENETTELVEVENNEVAEVEERDNNGLKRIVTVGVIVGVTYLVAHKVIKPAINKLAVKIAAKKNGKKSEDEIIVEDSDENVASDKNQEEQK